MIATHIYPKVDRTDDDCAAVVWRNGRKLLVSNLNAYGGATVRCGLADPPGGSVEVASFEAGWRWLAAPGEELPPPAPHETQQSIGTWIDATFPGADPNTPRKALRTLEEVIELCLVCGASPKDIDQAVGATLSKEGGAYGTPAWIARCRRPEKIPAEAADAAIVLMGLAQLHGFDLQEQVDKKMAINRARRWKANGDGTGYHVKEEPWTPKDSPPPPPPPTV